MSIALHELLLCCRQLETDKATERRKEIDKFRRLLRDKETIQNLDRNSDNRHNKLLNWDTVFRFLQKYINKETESLKSGKTNVSHTTQAARQKKMQEISCLVKYFIRCANKRKLFATKDYVEGLLPENYGHIHKLGTPRKPEMLQALHASALEEEDRAEVIAAL